MKKIILISFLFASIAANAGVSYSVVTDTNGVVVSKTNITITNANFISARTAPNEALIGISANSPNHGGVSLSCADGNGYLESVWYGNYWFHMFYRAYKHVFQIENSTNYMIYDGSTLAVPAISYNTDAGARSDLVRMFDLPCIPRNALQSSKTAITNRTLRVIWVGDSITENPALTDTEDTYPARLTRMLQAALPGVTILSTNMALGGRTAANIVDPAYTATNPETANHFYRSWATTGSNWLYSVSNSLPDLVVYAFGMNDAGGTIAAAPEYFHSNLSNFWFQSRSWSPAPSMIVVPTILPSTVNSAQNQAITLAIQDVARAFAAEKGLAVADAGRLYSIYRDGLDYQRSYGVPDTSWTNYPTGWSLETGSFSMAAGVLRSTAGGKTVKRAIAFKDGELSQTVTFPGWGTANLLGVYYRDDALNFMACFFTPGLSSTGSVAMYYHSTQVANVSASIGTNNAVLKITAKGPLHEVYVDGVKVVSITNYVAMTPGASVNYYAAAAGIYITGSIVSDTPLVGQSQFTETQLLGAYNLTTGHGINHPSEFGIEACYVRAFDRILSELAR